MRIKIRKNHHYDGIHIFKTEEGYEIHIPDGDVTVE